MQFSIHVTSTVPKNIDSYLFISSIFENYILGKLISNFNIELSKLLMNFLSIKPLTMNKYVLPGYRLTLSLVTWKKTNLEFS